MTKIKQISQAWKELELNKQTSDVKRDLGYIQVKSRVKYYIFTGLSIAAAVGVWYYSMQYIASDDFRKGLIEEAGVSPVLSFMYSDHSEEYDTVKKEAGEVKKKINDLRKQYAELLRISKNKYDLNMFYDDLKSGSEHLPDDLIVNSEAFEKYLQTYLVYTLIFDENTLTLEVNRKTYTPLQIKQKVKNLPYREMISRLDLPAKSLLQKFGLPSSPKFEQMAKSILYTYVSMSKFKYKKIKNSEGKVDLPAISDAKKKIEEAIKNKERNINIGGVKYLSLWDLRKKISDLFKEVQIKKASEYEARQNEAKTKIAGLKKEIDKLKKEYEILDRKRHILYLIKHDPSRYFELVRRYETFNQEGGK